ncbi:MAG: YceI family protein, partial [Acidobacteriota bacterium]
MTKTNLRLAAVALAAFTLIALAVAPLTAEHHETSSPGSIEWKANNAMYSAHGSFKNWKFTNVDVPDGDIEKATVELEISLTSVSEKAEALAEHLRQADFFNVAKFATSTVKIHGATKTGDNTYDATATVDLHGHTSDVPVSFTVVGTSPLQIEGTATLQRTAFGIGGPYDASNERS